MLPPFIIEQIRRREEERARQEQPRLELPLPFSTPPLKRSEPHEDGERGVIIIDLG